MATDTPLNMGAYPKFYTLMAKVKVTPLNMGAYPALNI